MMLGFVKPLSGGSANSAGDSVLRSRPIWDKTSLSDNQYVMEYVAKSIGTNVSQLRRNGNACGSGSYHGAAGSITGFNGALMIRYMDMNNFIFGQPSQHYWDFPFFYNIKGLGGIKSGGDHRYVYIAEGSNGPVQNYAIWQQVITGQLDRNMAENGVPRLTSKGSLSKASSKRGNAAEGNQPGLVKSAVGVTNVVGEPAMKPQIVLDPKDAENSTVRYGILQAFFRYMVSKTKDEVKGFQTTL
jgi:hypothetical protein